MRFLFHNKLEVKTTSFSYIYFNQMLSSVYDALKSLQPFNKHISIGRGLPSDAQNSFKLTSHLKTFETESDFLQNDVSKELVFVSKNLVISDSSLSGKNITELGFSNGNNDSPTIYNYFSLIDDETPEGIKILENEPVYIKITIYLSLENESDGLLTLGNNRFVSFLLGEGIDGEIYVTQGNNNIENTFIKRETPLSEKLPCKFEFFEQNESVTLCFSSDYITEKTYEIVFLIKDEPFARINLQNFKSAISETTTITPKTNYVLDLSEDVKSHLNVTNLTSSEAESEIYSRHYATDFGDEIILPFNELFSYETPRFVSKDGDKIFFVQNDTVYGYKNEKYQVLEIKTGDISIQEISKIISFDNFVFVVKKIEPFIEIFKIVNLSLKRINIDDASFENITVLNNIYDIDITISKLGMFQIGIIDSTNYNGHAIYCTYDENTNTFFAKSTSTSEYKFSYVLAMFKTNFSDSMLMFLKAGEHSNDCRLVRFYPDETISDVYSVLAYYYTFETKEIYAKNRAIVVEKTSSPKLWIYYYPQMYRYNLSLLESEENSYLSTNLLYLIQKNSSSNFKIYNLVGYDTPTEFKNGFPSNLNTSEIVDFEFLEDTLLIFLGNKKIVAYNLKQTGYLIENVSSNSDSYEVSYEKFDLLGSDGEKFKVSFEVKVEI